MDNKGLNVEINNAEHYKDSSGMKDNNNVLMYREADPTK